MTREHGLGRLYIPDSRDKNFPMAAPRQARGEDGRFYRNWLVPGPVRDQGPYPHCVAYACEAFLRAHPIVNAHTAELALDIPALYVDSQRVDQWPGEDYEGTSVRAGFDVLRKRGLVGEYTWGWDALTIARHVLAVSPVVVGTLWTDGMERPDRHGYIAPTGYVWGGHAYLITGVDTEERNPDGSTGRFRIQNSWGPEWADGGRAWISMSHMSLLMSYEGEACAATEIRVR